MFFELNLRSKKWPLRCSYNPHKSLIKEHLKELIKAIQFCSKTHDNLMLIGDYNAQVDETNMASFCEIYELRSLINEPTCYKNPLNPSCIDLFLTNNVNSFQKTFVSETGLSDFHKLIGRVMKSPIPKQKPNIIKHLENANILIKTNLKKKF